MIVLDTHTLLWWASGDEAQLGRAARTAIARERKADGALLVSSISAWEIAMLVARGRLSLSMEVADWLATASRIDPLRFVPVDNAIALDAVALPGQFHADPADRIIVATARKFGALLLTRDGKIRDYAHVRSAW